MGEFQLQKKEENLWPTRLSYCIKPRLKDSGNMFAKVAVHLRHMTCNKFKGVKDRGGLKTQTMKNQQNKPSQKGQETWRKKQQDLIFLFCFLVVCLFCDFVCFYVLDFKFGWGLWIPQKVRSNYWLEPITQRVMSYPHSDCLFIFSPVGIWRDVAGLFKEEIRAIVLTKPMSTNSEIWFEGKFCRVLLHFFRQSFPNLETVYEPYSKPSFTLDNTPFGFVWEYSTSKSAGWRSFSLLNFHV